MGPWTVKVVCPAVWSSSSEVGREKRDVEPDLDVDDAVACVLIVSPADWRSSVEAGMDTPSAEPASDGAAVAVGGLLSALKIVSEAVCISSVELGRVGRDVEPSNDAELVAAVIVSLLAEAVVGPAV